MEIKLSKKVLEHIVKRHPEVAAYATKIVETIQDPDLVIKGLTGELKALKFCTELCIGPKYLVVIYLEAHEERVIIAAYFTSNVGRVKGEVTWRKQQ